MKVLWEVIYDRVWLYKVHAYHSLTCRWCTRWVLQPSTYCTTKSCSSTRARNLRVTIAPSPQYPRCRQNFLVWNVIFGGLTWTRAWLERIKTWWGPEAEGGREEGSGRTSLCWSTESDDWCSCIRTIDASKSIPRVGLVVRRVRRLV